MLALQIVTFAAETRNVLAVCYTSDLLRGLLPTLLEQLEMCQKSLTAYLETKRAEFPRFYFVSDPTLLEILSLGSDPPSVVPHFQSGLFDSLSGVTFDKVSSTLPVALSCPLIALIPCPSYASAFMPQGLIMQCTSCRCARHTSTAVSLVYTTLDTLECR